MTLKRLFCDAVWVPDGGNATNGAGNIELAR